MSPLEEPSSYSYGQGFKRPCLLHNPINVPVVTLHLIVIRFDVIKLWKSSGYFLLHCLLMHMLKKYLYSNTFIFALFLAYNSMTYVNGFAASRPY